MLENTPLEGAVLESLDGDPRITDSTEIAVSADGGIVTLRGTVERLSQRRAAAAAANKIHGVYESTTSSRSTSPPRIVARTTRSAEPLFRL